MKEKEENLFRNFIRTHHLSAKWEMFLADNKAINQIPKKEEMKYLDLLIQENFNVFDEVFEDEDVSFFYKSLIKTMVEHYADDVKAETIEKVLKVVQSTIDRTHVLVLASDLTDLLTQIKQL